MPQESIKNLIEVSAKQADFLKNSTHSFNICSGVTRSGKTFANVLRFYDFMYREAPNKSLHLITGKTSEALYDNFIRPILDFDFAGDVYVNATHTLLRIKSKRIECRLVGCDNEKAYDKIKGKTVYSWWADEITGHPESIVDMACTRCTEGGVQRPKFWTCNPDYPSHFIKKRFIDNKKLDVKNWYFGFADNPTLTKELLDELKAAFTGVFYERMILGLWTIAEGVVYDKFDPSLHCKQETDIPWRSMETYVMGIDWGYEKALAMTLYGIENDGTWWQIDEYKEAHKQVDEALINEIKEMGWYKLPLWRWNGISWDIYETKPECAYGDSNRPEYIKLFSDLSGISTIPAIKPDKLSMIRPVQTKHILNKNTGKYGIYYGPKCNETVSEKQQYRWKKNSTDEVIKENDHLMDCEQYAIFTRERGRVTRFK